MKKSEMEEENFFKKKNAKLCCWTLLQIKYTMIIDEIIMKWNEIKEGTDRERKRSLTN